MKLNKILLGVLAGVCLAGCTVDADDDDADVVTPGSSTTVIEEDKPDVNVTPAPDVDIKTDTPAGTVTTTGQ